MPLENVRTPEAIDYGAGVCRVCTGGGCGDDVGRVSRSKPAPQGDILVCGTCRVFKTCCYQVIVDNREPDLFHGVNQQTG